MPMGSSSAAPVMSPGPRVFKKFLPRNVCRFCTLGVMPTSATAGSPLGINARLTVSRANDKRIDPAIPHREIIERSIESPPKDALDGFDGYTGSPHAALDRVFSFAFA